MTYRKCFFACAAAALLLTGCGVPEYDEALFKNLERTNDNVGNIYTRVTVINSGSSVPFSDLEVYFTEALSGIAAAESLLAKHADARRSTLSDSVTGSLQESVMNCKDSITGLMGASKRRPMTETRISAYSTDIVCDFTQRTADLTR